MIQRRMRPHVMTAALPVFPLAVSYGLNLKHMYASSIPAGLSPLPISSAIAHSIYAAPALYLTMLYDAIS